MDVGSLEGVSELGSSEGEVTGLGTVVKSGTVDVKLGLRSIDTELGAWSMNLVLNGWASVLEGTIGSLVDVFLVLWLVEGRAVGLVARE